jgi:hypothetical protein
MAWNSPLSPGSERLVARPASPRAEGGVIARTILLAIVVAVGLVAYLGVRPHQPWILWLTAALAALATDGIVRQHHSWRDESPYGALVYMLLPALAALGAGFFIHYAIDGYVRPLLGLFAAAGVGAIALGEYHTVDASGRTYGAIRLAMAVATYLTAFALYTVIFVNDLPLWLGIAFVALASTALGLELLRESRMFGLDALIASMAVGLSVGELRLALYFFPLDGLLAGALLIIGFYLATGLVHHLLDHDLELSTVAEYVLVAGVGTAAVIITRVVV